ncbi:MAG: hypothetical protein ACJ70Z_08490 [Nitrososphaera sp.]
MTCFQINPLAAQVMKEVGIDISSQKSKIVTEDMIRNSTSSVNMGCIDKAEYPTLFRDNVIVYGIEDPKSHSREALFHSHMICLPAIFRGFSQLCPNFSCMYYSPNLS